MTSFFHRFLFDFCSELGSPKPQKSLKFRVLYISFLFFTLFKIRSIFNPILVPTWLHFPSQNPLKSIQKSILKGIDFLIDFDIDFKTSQDGPKTAQDGDPSAKTVPRAPQDGSKMAPSGAKSWIFLGIFRSWPPRAPKASPISLQE